MASESVPNNIYTILITVALIALLAGVIFLLYRSNQLFGTINPLDAKQLSMFLPTRLQTMIG